jgi:hypothetical protein
VRLFLLAGLLVGCDSPTVHPGAPCGPGGACPGNLVCAVDQTCQPPGVTPDASGDSSPIGDGPADSCTTCAAPANDLPAGAIDISAGGDFTADLTYAHDDAQRGSSPDPLCGGDGGLDVFYTIHVASSEVYYLDTFDSDFDTVIRVFHGSCAGGAAPSGTQCRNDATSCNSVQTQFASTLTTGDNCVVVDGVDGTQTGHTLHLHVEPGGRTGSHISTSTVPSSPSFMGDTTGLSNQSQASCAMHVAPDRGYYLYPCPGQSISVTATTCNQTTATAGWDTVLYASGPAGELACTDDDGTNCSIGGGLSTISFTATDAHLYWVVVDAGGDNEAGAYELDVSLM